MVAIYSSTTVDPGSTRQAWSTPDSAVRKAEPPARPRAQYRETSEDAPYLSAQIFTPFVAQALAQFDAADPPPDPREAAAAYRRTTDVQFAPADILPPL